MNNNYYNKLRDYKRKFDFGDFDSPKGKKFTKKRSHKRSRRQLKIPTIEISDES